VTADRLWKSNHPDYEAQKEEKTVSVK